MPFFKIYIEVEGVTSLVEDMETWQVDRALKRARNEIKRESVRLYNRPIRTWTNKPVFVVRTTDGDGRYGFTIATGSKIFVWVDQGTGLYGPFRRKYPIPSPDNTDAKILRFREGYRARTKVGSLTSGAKGYYGPWVFRKQVMHPGIEGRGFTEQIVERIEERSVDAIMWAVLDWWYHGHRGQELPPSNQGGI